LRIEPPARKLVVTVPTVVQVIGVAANTVSGWVGTGLDRPLVYFPTSTTAWDTRYIVEVTGDPAVLRRTLSDEMEIAAPGATDAVHTLREILAVQVYPFRAAGAIAGAL